MYYASYDDWKLATPWDDDPEPVATIITLRVSTSKDNFAKWQDEKLRDIEYHDWDCEDAWCEFTLDFEADCWLECDDYERECYIDKDSVDDAAYGFVRAYNDEFAEYEITDYNEKPRKPKKRA